MLLILPRLLLAAVVIWLLIRGVQSLLRPASAAGPAAEPQVVQAETVEQETTGADQQK